MGDYYTVRTRIVESRGTEHFELGDNEEIIEGVVHGDGVKLFILSPVDFKCGYIKDDGEPCGISVSGPEERCHHHE